MTESGESAQPDRVECTASKDPAVRLFIFAAMLIGFGVWCFLHAYIQGKYPYPEDGNINGVIGHYFNHVGGILLPLLGLVPLVWGVLSLRRKLVATEEGIGYEGKEAVGWDRITRLDATELPDKGLVHLEYGADKPMTLDSWKLNNFRAIVAFVEQHVPEGAIDQPEMTEAPDAEEPADPAADDKPDETA